MQLTGIHHLTAITAGARHNHDFYTRTLGMRLVKKTVNQDDTSAYHLFYGDGEATPGSDITFFDWPAAPERLGTRSISRTALRVTGCLIVVEAVVSAFGAKIRLVRRLQHNQHMPSACGGLMAYGTLFHRPSPVLAPTPL